MLDPSILVSIPHPFMVLPGNFSRANEMHSSLCLKCVLGTTHLHILPSQRISDLCNIFGILLSMACTVGVFNLTGMRLVTMDDLVQMDLLPPKISILLESLSDCQIEGENNENATFISPLVFTWLNLSCSLHRSLCR